LPYQVHEGKARHSQCLQSLMGLAKVGKRDK
jgi:hypothetical protein